MIKKIYAVYDKKQQSTQPIYEQVNNMVAIRDFSMLCSNEKVDMIRTYPEDYCLMCLGEFDTETGVITPSVQTIAEASEYVTK